MLHVGITGTRSGMNKEQKDNITKILRTIIDTTPQVSLHHGDCIGVDVEVANIAKAMGYFIINHPPTNEDLRAFHESNAYRQPMSYFARNKQIVDECSIMFVIPFQNAPQGNGGTWYTYDYALKKGKSLTILYSDGRIVLK